MNALQKFFAYVAYSFTPNATQTMSECWDIAGRDTFSRKLLLHFKRIFNYAHYHNLTVLVAEHTRHPQARGFSGFCRAFFGLKPDYIALHTFNDKITHNNDFVFDGNMLGLLGLKQLSYAAHNLVKCFVPGLFLVAELACFEWLVSIQRRHRYAAWYDFAYHVENSVAHVLYFSFRLLSALGSCLVEPICLFQRVKKNSTVCAVLCVLAPVALCVACPLLLFKYVPALAAAPVVSKISAFVSAIVPVSSAVALSVVAGAGLLLRSGLSAAKSLLARCCGWFGTRQGVTFSNSRVNSPSSRTHHRGRGSNHDGGSEHSERSFDYNSSNDASLKQSLLPSSVPSNRSPIRRSRSCSSLFPPSKKQDEILPNSVVDMDSVLHC